MWGSSWLGGQRINLRPQPSIDRGSHWTLLQDGRNESEQTAVKVADDSQPGALLRTNFLRVCSAYFSPSAKFSNTPAVLVSLLTLTSGLMQILCTN
uniref:Uncharacterized protein n=1 Tax=Nelumbo nucifera TaxID=4432 RepID=A0A822ZGP0_NELNU|nr:TPA_asm: hypothetical protein HUJ06_002277 [Nelumbo nucifera]